jgi:hypothetical protein
MGHAFRASLFKPTSGPKIMAKIADIIPVAKLIDRIAK